uniref:Coiled coil domain 201 n=1 Tax=Nannospalax galili TaxID=1026970 RepID=A0A8C6RBI7_NANGA
PKMFMYMPEFLCSTSLLTERPRKKKPAKPSTPQKMDMGWSPRPQGKASQIHRSLLPAHSSQDLGGVGPTATFRKRRLSTVQDFEGPYSDHSVAGNNPPMSASLNKQQQKIKVLKAVSSPRNLRLPGIPDTARKKRRDKTAQAAAMQRVRQWEARLLQEIEDAVYHELTIQGVLSTELSVQAQGALSINTIEADTQDPAALA